MECKEAEKLIRKFIDDELDYGESIEFRTIAPPPKINISINKYS